jgi:parvulin-like peptidyl-prolyl isomerase
VEKQRAEQGWLREQAAEAASANKALDKEAEAAERAAKEAAEQAAARKAAEAAERAVREAQARAEYDMSAEEARTFSQLSDPAVLKEQVNETSSALIHYEEIPFQPGHLKPTIVCANATKAGNSHSRSLATN